MKTKSGSRKRLYLARFDVFLIMAALIAGIMGHGCTPSEGSEIRTWYGLDAIRDDLTGDYTLMNDLDSATPGYQNLASPTANGGKGWESIGWGQDAFTGSLDGRGYEIRDLYINRSEEYSERVGLFGQLGHGGVVENIGVVNVTVICYSYVDGLVEVRERSAGNRPLGIGLGNGSAVGGLVGLSEGTVTSSYSSGSVTGDWMVGGLVGMNEGTVNNSYSTGSVTGGWHIGGLVGEDHGTVSNSHSASEVAGDGYVGGLMGLGGAMNCYSTGNVTGIEIVGGLVGFGGAVNSYSTGDVAGNQKVGGLVGRSGDAVSGSYCTGNVTGYVCVGGLVGENWNTAVNNSYSSSSVTGNSSVGGLVGMNDHGTVSNSYSTGSVTGNWNVGGLVGDNYGTTSNSFWDTETSGQSTSGGGTGKNTTEMKEITTFSIAGWNIIAVAVNETNPDHIWNIVNNVTYPFLSWQS